MKTLIVSKALVSAMYRKKLTALGELGMDIVAVVPPSWREGGREQRLEPAEPEGFELIESPLRWNGQFHFHYYPELGRIVRSVRPDLLYMDEEPFNLATLLGVRSAGRAGIPSIFYTWQNLLRRYPLPARLVEKHVYRKVARGLAGTEDAANVLRAKGFNKGITVVPQFGVDPQIFSPGSPPDGPFTVGFFNRLVPAKGVLETLSAVGGLPKDVCLSVVGDGPLRSELMRRVEAGGLGDRVLVSTRVPSQCLPDLIRGVHVVVLPSLTMKSWKEQFGRILIEAMSCAVPVVGTDSGEIPRVIGQAGLVVPEGDVDALRAALLRLYEDPELRTHLGRSGRERVLARFTNQRVAEVTYEGCVLALRTES